METLLNVEGINVYYGAIHAIKDISFHVNEGEIVTLIGANGAGKTTTLQTISGLLRSKTGSITFEGQNISSVRADKLVARGLAQVPEGRRVFLQMSVEENLEMGAYTQSPSGVPADLEMVFELFPRLKERRRQVAGTLSAAARWPAPSPAASSRCWPWAGPSCPTPSCSCWTSPPWVWPPSWWNRSLRSSRT